MIILQDHVCELSQVAAACGRPIFFPFLTNDIFRLTFSASFDELNKKGIYKSIIKHILLKYADQDFVHRKKIGFQSPSRNYFVSSDGLGLEIHNLFQREKSNIFEMNRVKASIKSRLTESLSSEERSDFVEWTVFNLLRLEALRDGC